MRLAGLHRLLQELLLDLAELDAAVLQLLEQAFQLLLRSLALRFDAPLVRLDFLQEGLLGQAANRTGGGLEALQGGAPFLPPLRGPALVAAPLTPER